VLHKLAARVYSRHQQLPLNPDEISGVCGRLLCCLSYEDEVYRDQNKKMPKLGAEVVTPHGTGRVRHIHPLKETVTVMLENHALVEVAVGELISTKTAAGHSCSTCGGCTTKRRAGAEEDNARMRDANKRRGKESSRQAQPSPVPTEDEAEDDLGETDIDSDAAPGAGPADSPRRKRRRRTRNRSERGGDRSGDKGKGGAPRSD
jgi:hypothetical protein